MDRNFLDSYLPLLGGGVGGEPNFNKRQLTNQMVSHGKPFSLLAHFHFSYSTKPQLAPAPHHSLIFSLK